MANGPISLKTFFNKNASGSGGYLVNIKEESSSVKTAFGFFGLIGLQILRQRKCL